MQKEKCTTPYMVGKIHTKMELLGDLQKLFPSVGYWGIPITKKMVVRRRGLQTQLNHLVIARHATLRLAQARPLGEQPSTDMSAHRRPSSAGGAAVDNDASLLSLGRLRRRVLRAAQTTPGSGGDDVILPQSPPHRRIRRGWRAKKDDSSGRRFLRSRRLRR